MKFEEVMSFLRTGKKVTRKAWEGTGMFVVWRKGYPDGVPCDKATAEAFGIEEGSIIKINPYCQLKNINGSISNWQPSLSEGFSNDWEVLD